MWCDEVILWKEGHHSWDALGVKTTQVLPDQDELYAKGIVIWRKQSFGELVEKLVEVFDAANSFLEDRNILTGVILTITTANLFPLHLKIVQEDEVANDFLSLIRNDNGEYFILKEELNNSAFGDNEAVKELMSYFTDQSLLEDSGDRFVISGRVLNSAHLERD